MKIKAALLIVLCFLFIACYQSVDLMQPVDIPPGMGVFFLSVGDVHLRAFAPSPGTDHFISYTLEFFIAGADYTGTVITQTIDSLAAPVLVEIGDYDLQVTANSSQGAAARGRALGIQIVSGTPVVRTINLEAFMTGTGTGMFRYNITLPAGLTIAILDLFLLSDDPNFGELKQTIDLLNGGASGTRTDTIPNLDSGNYRIYITLKKDDDTHPVVRREILHIYDNLTTVYEFEFLDTHFNKITHRSYFLNIFYCFLLSLPALIQI